MSVKSTHFLYKIGGIIFFSSKIEGNYLFLLALGWSGYQQGRYQHPSIYVISNIGSYITLLYFRYLILAVFSGVVAFIAGNMITIAVFVMSRQFRRRCSNLFLVSLALADLGVSVFVTTVKVDLYYHNNSFCHNLHLCVFFQVSKPFKHKITKTSLIFGTEKWGQKFGTGWRREWEMWSKRGKTRPSHSIWRKIFQVDTKSYVIIFKYWWS